MENQTFIRFAFFCGILGFLIILECVSPLVYGRKHLTGNRFENTLLLFCTIGLSRLLVSMSAVSAAMLAQLNDFGFLNSFPFPASISFVIAIILLDFFIYWQHVAMHAFPLLWRFHQVHHTDRHLDTTTGFRFHPGEIILSAGYKWLIICLLGASPNAVVVFEIILSGFALFTHSNSRLSLRSQQLLEKVFITPEAHWVHHSERVLESQKNFGFCLCIWDRLFKTYTRYPLSRVLQLTFGVDGVKATRNNFIHLFLQPFQGMTDLNYLLRRRR